MKCKHTRLTRQKPRKRSEWHRYRCRDCGCIFPVKRPEARHA